MKLLVAAALASLLLAKPEVDINGGSDALFATAGDNMPGAHAIHGGSGGSSAQATAVEYETCAGHPICSTIRCAQGEIPMVFYVPSGPNQAAGPFCSSAMTQVTPALALRAFRRVPVPTPVLHIQPVKGTTLVNLRTNFYATGGDAFTRTLTLLGHGVTLRVHVDHYLFRFGDGATLTTQRAGAAYPALVDTHIYLRKGVVRPQLETTWAADYRVDGGAWRTVAGTVSKAGRPRRLRVITATPVLTAPRWQPLIRPSG